ncbi:cupin domain-containing protein [Psychrobacter arenosus]|uniref:cupin domain-containing protein n=1 Tax=Psychrobacter arenosus TaxID=256326 RepID=UPI00191AF13B|nr:cupin domain-containing protein [Psychrobacter arenosus]
MTSLKLCLPDTITPAQFLADYWQKKPLLIKQGLPRLIDMFEPEDILGLALDEEALARLLVNDPNPADKDAPQWTMKKSPLTEDDLAPLLEQSGSRQNHTDDELASNWTVLVQNLEQWSPELGQLWQAFDFIPQWQRDDIMVSYAPAGGSVGRHYDDYDVFLAQGFGSRRWQLGQYCDETTAFVTNEPIRIFDDMGEIIFDEVLKAGDVLYVPPKLAHYGVAVEDCLTFSFGFRRPNLMQIMDSLADVATSEQSLFVPMLLEQTLQSSGELQADSIAQIKAQLIEMLASERGDELIRQSVSEVISKRQYDLLIPEETVEDYELVEALATDAVLKIDYSSRLIYTQDTNGEPIIYANGQRLEDISLIEAQLLKHLADGGTITKEHLSTDDYEVDPATVMQWLENGWVWLDDSE